MSHTLKLTVIARSGKPFAAYLRRRLRAAHRLMRTRLKELSVVLVGDRFMSELNQSVMNHRGPTDVLTFPLELDARGRAVSGEIVLCVPEARRRAREFGTDARKELLLYAVHGMLHLSGFDDRTPEEFDRMHRTEDRILSRLGVGPVFSPDATPRRTAGAATAAPGAQRR